MPKRVRTVGKLTRRDRDPTGQAANRGRAIKDIKRRLRGAQADVLAIIEQIPVTKRVINAGILVNRVQYDWQVDADRLSQTESRIKQVVASWFNVTSDTKPRQWFFDQYMGFAYDGGTGDSLANMQGQLLRAGIPEAVTQQLDIERILLQPQYLDAVSMVYGRAYNEMQGFSGDLGVDLARVLSNAVTTGQSPRQAAKTIRDEFGQSISRGERIARTEINRAYTTSRTKQAKRVEQELGIEVRVAHVSVLGATTRKTHAQRHGKTYTMDEQEEWWDSGANRINCLCSITEVVFDDGEPLDPELLERMEQQAVIWLRTA